MFKDIKNAAIRLLVITVVAAIALAGVNLITKGPIAERRQADADASMLAAMPDATSFEPLEIPSDGTELGTKQGKYKYIREAFIARQGGAIVGYVVSAAPMGYKGEIPITFGFDVQGVMTRAIIGDISETAGIGSKVKDDDFLQRFEGVANEDAPRIDTISGATISSSAVKNAAIEASDFINQIIIGGE